MKPPRAAPAAAGKLQVLLRVKDPKMIDSDWMKSNRWGPAVAIAVQVRVWLEILSNLRGREGVSYTQLAFICVLMAHCLHFSPPRTLWRRCKRCRGSGALPCKHCQGTGTLGPTQPAP